MNCHGKEALKNAKVQAAKGHMLSILKRASSDHDALEWTALDRDARLEKSRTGIRRAHALRHDILLNTLDVSRELCYHLEAATIHTMMKRTQISKKKKKNDKPSKKTQKRIGGISLLYGKDAIDVAVANHAVLVVPQIGGHPGGPHERDGFLEPHVFRRTTLGVAIPDYTSLKLPCIISGIQVIRGREYDGYPVLLQPQPLQVAIMPPVKQDLGVPQAFKGALENLRFVGDTCPKLCMAGLYGMGNQQRGSLEKCSSMLRELLDIGNFTIFVVLKSHQGSSRDTYEQIHSALKPYLAVSKDEERTHEET